MMFKYLFNKNIAYNHNYNKLFKNRRKNKFWILYLIITRDFDNVGFPLSTAFKDVQLIMETSSDVHAPLPFANIIRDKLIAAIANDLAKKD
ncbi:MAG TPA: hypothetical protein VN704_05000 [Verrucomicrobiae bacterium]|nr:hypothetical protein [Verrucomicrobiae bacterium]